MLSDSGAVEFSEFLEMYSRKKKTHAVSDEEEEVRQAFKVSFQSAI